jgi:hypothetical protein
MKIVFVEDLKLVSPILDTGLVFWPRHQKGKTVLVSAGGRRVGQDRMC